MKKNYAAILRNFIPVLFLFGMFSGCKIIDPAEEIPSYLHIDSISLSTTAVQGSASHKITDAWIFMDGQLIGGFELPCTVPILAEGSHHFLIRAGIKMNGDNGTRAIYPFYKGWEGDLSLRRTETLTTEPSVTYFPGIDFSSLWICDFETVGTNFGPNPPYNTPVNKDSVDVFEGSYSGSVHLNADTIQFVGSSSWYGPLAAADEIYLEMNYKCTAGMTIGLYCLENGQYYGAVSLGANTDWTKIYIRLSDAAAIAPAGATFKVYIGMFKPSDVDVPTLHLDNLKLVKFQ
jgi:hypothetical protein